MSHIIQEYAKSCGVKIGEPKISPTFFPIVEEKYITIYHGNCRATHYEYWEEVLEILSPILSKKKIKIVQLLDSETQKIQSAHKHISVSKKQAAFIIQNSLCHVGTDSIYCYFAGEFSVPLVSIYSHTHPNNTRPWKRLKNKTKEICSFEQVGRPSYDPNEQNKTINSVKPEVIAKDIIDALGIKKEIKFKTLFIGSRYNEQCVDVVPTEPINIQHPKINVRMDICHNEEVLQGVLQNNFAEVTLSAPISEKLLSLRRISVINYIAESFDESFVKRVKNLGIHINLLCVSEEQLSAQRFKFFDYEVIFHDLNTIAKENAEKIKDILDNKVKAKSNKKILIGNKQYFSYLEALKSQELFLLDLDWLYIYTAEND
jgi:hypothetical protein